jgi:putative membrane protein
MSLTDLPLVNACLNGLSTVFLVLGYMMIRRGRETAHRNLMVAAVVTSTLFLISYLTYHFQVPRTVFRDPEWFRPYYLLILGTHTVLAMVLLPLVIQTLLLAFRRQLTRHRRWAKWTWPIWMYVSVTGVVIYLLLYQIYPQPRGASPPPVAAEVG